VRDVAARHKDKAKAYRGPVADGLRDVRAFFWTVQRPPVPHPAFLRNATLSSFVERDSRRAVAPTSGKCRHDGCFVNNAASPRRFRYLRRTFRPPLLLAALALLALPAAASLDGAIGAKLFKRNWVSAPSSTKSNDGLGPLFAATSCAGCHPGGGAGARPVVRFGQGLAGDPVYGRELQSFGVLGLLGEGEAKIGYEAGRTSITLDKLADGPLDPATRVGIRQATALVGLGEAERLGDDAILAGENGQGRHGRAHRLADGRIGRFGWKATTASLADQTALAFSLDLGLSTAQFPDPFGDCTARESACRAMPTGSDHGEPEIPAYIVAALAALVGDLPAPRPASTAGAEAFAATGCAACHRPVLRDSKGNQAALFSDLLLHDMGMDLDDGIAEAGAASSEWRTAPLIDLGSKLSQGLRLLHDGRAATIEEAIAAHGGDGDEARRNFAAAPPAERAALLSYLRGL